MNAALYYLPSFFGIGFVNGTIFYIRKAMIEPPVPLDENGDPLDAELHCRLMQRSAYNFKHTETAGEC